MKLAEPAPKSKSFDTRMSLVMLSRLLSRTLNTTTLVSRPLPPMRAGSATEPELGPLAKTMLEPAPPIPSAIDWASPALAGKGERKLPELSAKRNLLLSVQPGANSTSASTPKALDLTDRPSLKLNDVGLLSPSSVTALVMKRL